MDGAPPNKRIRTTPHQSLEEALCLVRGLFLFVQAVAARLIAHTFLAARSAFAGVMPLMYLGPAPSTPDEPCPNTPQGAPPPSPTSPCSLDAAFQGGGDEC